MLLTQRICIEMGLFKSIRINWSSKGEQEAFSYDMMSLQSIWLNEKLF